MKAIAISAADVDLELVSDFVKGQITQCDLTPRIAYQLEVVIEEILVNIASYSGLSADEAIEVRCEVLNDPFRLVMQFIDGGIPFDPLAADDPDITPDGHMNREGGLGIFMVKKMMDETAYEYENGQNKLTVVKNLC